LNVTVLPTLRGAGQMLFQSSALTGGAFLLLIFSQSAVSFTACLAGLAGSTLCAYYLEYPGRTYAEGEGGFNGGLLGLSLAVFYQFGAELLLIAFIGGVFAGLVRVGLLRLLPVPPFTAPFVLVAWPAFLCANTLGLAPLDMPAIDPWPAYAIVTNASQVLFVLHPWVGLLVFIAVMVHSRIAALWITAASVVAWLVALGLGLPDELLAPGLLGYNALILAAALQHRDSRWYLFLAGIVCSVCLSYLSFHYGMAPLSAPFVISAWLVIGAETLMAKRANRG
jgi:urea transporter